MATKGSKMKRGMLRHRKALLTLLITPLIVAACGSGSNSNGTTTTSSEVPNAPSSLVDCAALIGMNASIDPALSSDFDSGQVARAMFDGLVDYDYTDSSQPELKPLVADEWSSNSEMTTWTFHIRDGQEFSNGEPVLPSSFAAGWNRAVAPALEATYSYLFSTIAGYSEVQSGKATTLAGVIADDAAMTLTVNLVTASSEFPALVTHTIFSPVPSEEISALPDSAQWSSGVMSGNGPFAMKGPADEIGVTLVPNENWEGNVYGESAPLLTELQFRAWIDEASAFAAFESGDCQIARVPVGEYAAMANEYAVVDDLLYGSNHFVFGWNDSKVGGEDNLKLRQAISLAINRNRINDDVYAGKRMVATGLIPPGLVGYKAGESQYTTQNIEAAKALLQEWRDAGHTLTEPIKISFNANAGQEAVVALMQEDLNAIGIVTVLDPQPTEEYFGQLWTAGCEQICRAGKLWAYPDASTALYELFSSETIGNGNLGQYSDTIFDDLVNQALAATDEVERESLLQQAESRLLNDTTGYMPITWYTGNYVFDPKALADLPQTPVGAIEWERVSRIG
jgi:oligopeptide transport system substrate-binding protein